MKPQHYIFTSESVAEGHPDKVCDQISDAVLDEILRKELREPGGDVTRARVACETYITRGMVIVGGEITTKSYVDIDELARRVIREIGYNHAKYGFNHETCAVINVIGRQSPDIAQGVDTGGAGDQGLMVGYACTETKELMPAPIMLAHRLVRQLSRVRKEKMIPWLGPDGKSQVTCEYQGGKVISIPRVVLAAQHTHEVVDASGNFMREDAKKEILEKVIKPVLQDMYQEGKTFWIVNGTGKFEIGGPQSDTGMTGRKIIVDTYGGEVPHGGGAFSGKDPTKVDRSGAYTARYIAKNIVAAGLAEKCEIQLAYAIGLADPVSVYANAHGTGKIPENDLIKLIRDHFQLTPKGMIEQLKLRQPIYQRTAAFGHFGREEEGFSWEKTDKVEELKQAAGK